jgi:hypothetical protein
VKQAPQRISSPYVEQSFQQLQQKAEAPTKMNTVLEDMLQTEGEAVTYSAGLLENLYSILTRAVGPLPLAQDKEDKTPPNPHGTIFQIKDNQCQVKVNLMAIGTLLKKLEEFV